MNPEEALLKFVEGIGNTDFSLVIVLIQAAFVVFWIVVIGWVWVDASDRTTNVAMKLGSVAIVTVLNVLGLIIYLVVRPKQTIQELYWADLERRYLKYETSELGDCPSCKYSLQPGFNICPNCGYQLKKQCLNCNVWVDKSYNYCPFCTAGVETKNISQEVVVEEINTSEKMIEEVNKSKEEAIKVVEGNQTKYVDRHGLLQRVKTQFATFTRRIGDAALRRSNEKKAKQAQEVPVKTQNNKKKDKKHKKRK